MKYKKEKDFLQLLCREYIEYLIENVGWTESQATLIRQRYIKHKSMLHICLDMAITSATYSRYLDALGMGDNCVVNGDTREIAHLQSKIAKLESERYTDGVGIELYREIIRESNKNDDKINANYKELAQFIAALDKQVAVDKQATVDNFAFLNNKIDTTKNEIMCYVNATFVPGVLKMPLQSICPEAMRRYNSWVAPTAQAPDTQTNNVVVTEDR